jgi:hypothetical protein
MSRFGCPARPKGRVAFCVTPRVSGVMASTMLLAFGWLLENGVVCLASVPGVKAEQLLADDESSPRHGVIWSPETLMVAGFRLASHAVSYRRQVTLAQTVKDAVCGTPTRSTPPAWSSPASVAGCEARFGGSLRFAGLAASYQCVGFLIAPLASEPSTPSLPWRPGAGSAMRSRRPSRVVVTALTRAAYRASRRAPSFGVVAERMRRPRREARSASTRLPSSLRRSGKALMLRAVSYRCRGRGHRRESHRCCE